MTYEELQNKYKELEKEIQDFKVTNHELAELCVQRKKQIKELEKENAELKERNEGYNRNRDRLKEIGFPTFMSCKEYAEQINKMKCCQNCKHSEEDNKSSTICDECFELCYWEMKE